MAKVTAPNAAHFKVGQEGYRKGTSELSLAGKVGDGSDAAGCLEALHSLHYPYCERKGRRGAF